MKIYVCVKPNGKKMLEKKICVKQFFFVFAKLREKSFAGKRCNSQKRHS